MTRQLNQTITQTNTGLTTSAGLNPTLENAVRTLGGDYPAAKAMACKLTTPAATVEIERAIRTLQIIKGKTYARALEKENGRAPETIADLGITSMLARMKITEAELEAWYQLAEQSKFQHTLFSPLPEKADARQMLDELRQKMIAKQSAAHELLRNEQESKALPGSTRLSSSSLRAAIGFGMWPLFFDQHKEEAYMLLQWEELPEAGRLEYFNGLGAEEKKSLWQLRTKEKREEATKAIFDRHYCNKSDKSDTLKK